MKKAEKANRYHPVEKGHKFNCLILHTGAIVPAPHFSAGLFWHWLLQMEFAAFFLDHKKKAFS